jgi:hypothetical protein
LLESTWHLIPKSQTITGINGDLYTPAEETIGILPVLESIRAADIESYQHLLDQKNKHSYLARQQGTKYAVIAVHSTAEKVLFKKLMQEDPTFNWTNSAPDWKQGAKVWNRHANGQDIFYKARVKSVIYTAPYILCRLQAESDHLVTKMKNYTPFHMESTPVHMDSDQVVTQMKNPFPFGMESALICMESMR